MGGCRCSYRNCTVKSDGSTHMFHYPVFDKVRCHQWLTNAQRLEFLNLKVSQLKNRVVCQHHFKDEYFMNYLKEKLTFEAVPTEDGPFCDSSQLPVSTIMPEVAKVTRDYIENEYLSTTEKKANFSVKYGDFLTNCELMDMVNLDIKSEKKQRKDNNCNVNNSNINSDIDANYIKLLLEPDKNKDNKCTKNPVVLKPVKPTVVGIEFEEIAIPSTENQKPSSNQMNNQNIKPPYKKIKILDEKRISEPIKVIGTLTPISSSFIIEPPKKKNDVNFVADEKIDNTILNNVSKVNKKTVDNVNSLKMQSISTFTVELSDPVNNNLVNQEISKPVREPNRSLVQISKVSTPQEPQRQIRIGKNSGPISSVLSKKKITPERVAAIEEKRKFNMKLRDIIESCLHNLDDNDKFINEKMSRVTESKNGNVVSEESIAPNIQEFTINTLEARLQRMEETLLCKINQNSERITELKDSLKSTCQKKKSSSAQTADNEEVRKRHLYQEISKYLSPEANSKIYEELFINKYAQKLPQCAPSPKKRRKRSFVNIL